MSRPPHDVDVEINGVVEGEGEVDGVDDGEGKEN